MAAQGRWVTRGGWVAAAVVVPVAGIWTGRPAFTSKPVGAALVVIGYELLLVAGGVLSAITTELLRRWQQRAIEQIDQSIGRRLSRFGRKYRKFLLSSSVSIDLSGLPTVGFHTPELDDVFVDLSLDPRAPHQVPAGLLPSVSYGGRHSIWRFLDGPVPIVLAVVAGPGSGKTTLLRHVAREVARNYSRPRAVPILIFLREQVHAVATDGVPLADLVRSTLGPLASLVPVGWFERQLERGRCVVLLDGLDEVATVADRRAVAGWIERQIAQYPRNDYVITSRPHGYRDNRVERAVVVQVRQLSSAQVERFVDKWYRAVSSGLTGASANIRLDADSEARDLLDRIARTPALFDLTVNPLLLTMVANVHINGGGRLPANRAQLYAEICHVVLGSRDTAKSLPLRLTTQQKESLLSGLALTMMRGQVRQLDHHSVVAELQPAVAALSPLAELSAAEFIADMEKNGLLVEREHQIYTFAHQTFQEYLAAVRIGMEPELVAILENAVDDPWWRETTLLYAARWNVDSVIRACLRSASTAALGLAFDCLEQSRDTQILGQDLQDQLDEMLASVSDTAGDRRQLMIRVIVARHLANRRRVDFSTELCLTPMTNRIYSFFLRDTQHSEPDGWSWSLSPDVPVVGVRREDAKAFVFWLNGLVGDERRYRLPNRAELDELAGATLGHAGLGPGQLLLSAWVEPAANSGQLERWLPTPGVDPDLVDRPTVAAAMQRDISKSAEEILPQLSLLKSRVAVTVLQTVVDCAPDLSEINGASTRIVDRAAALSNVRQLLRELSHDLDRAMDRELVFGFALALHPDHAIRWGRTVSRALDRGLALTRDRAGKLETTLRSITTDIRSHPLSDGLDRILELDTRLEAATLEAIALPSDSGNIHHRDVTPIMGHVLASGLSAAHECSGRINALEAFSRTLTDLHTGVVRSAAVPVELLENRLRALQVDVGESWRAEVGQRLRADTLALVNRKTALTPEAASASRLTALCLKMETDIPHPDNWLTSLGEIVAGITVLERRCTRQAAPLETIMLARD